jgi:hypothetical protein
MIKFSGQNYRGGKLAQLTIAVKYRIHYRLIARLLAFFRRTVSAMRFVRHT